MSKVISKDGTEIAYEKTGQGPALVLVDGALDYRSFGPMPELAKLLASNFTVTTYDRRGRGESGDSKSYALEREVEDLDALIDAAGGSAYVYGISSGACLALQSAIRLGRKISKLAMYEPPYDSSDGGRQAWKDYRTQLAKLLSEDRRDDALVLFMQFVGAPADQVEKMRHSPMWPKFEAIAPTMAYDAATMGEDCSVPIQRAARVTVPALVMNGTIGHPFMLVSAKALAKAIPDARQLTLEDQRHDVDLKVLAPVLVEFFTK